jgi:hypothetical protein
MKQKGVKAPEARKRNYVQTRSAELSAKGEKVDKAKRQELRKKFESGSVSRAGFYKKGERKALRASSTKSGGAKSTVTTPKAPTVQLPGGGTPPKPIKKDVGGRSRTASRVARDAARNKKKTPPVR